MKSLNRSILTAAIAALFASGAMAQTRVDTRGATDANNRVGSGGVNTSVGGRSTPWDIQNRIVSGTITGGKAFRGQTASGNDPQAFRGRTGSENVDNFVRNSSSVTTSGFATYNANQTRAYYGDSRGVNPPPGTVGVSTSGAWVAPRPTAWTVTDPRSQPVSADRTFVVNRPGETAQAGAVDLSYAPNAQTADAGLFGGQIGNVANLSDYTQLNSTTVSQLTPAQIKALQSDTPGQTKIPGQTELNTPGNSPVDAAPQQVPTPNGALNQAGILNNNLPNTSIQAVTPKSAPGEVDPSTINNSVTPDNGVEMGTIVRMTPKVAKAGQPDQVGDAAAAAADNGPKRPGQAAEEAARAFNKERAAAAKKGDENKTDQNNPTNAGPNNPNQPAKPGDPAAKPAADRPAGPPAKVGTFAGDATNANISQLLTKAEAEMKLGKFGSAIDTYGQAEAASPRNATVRLGRANAELGGAYYRRAEQSLRSAFTADKKLLNNQYDLRAFLGDDRLQTIQKDLGDIVLNKPEDTGSALLLAYVYYNTGNERRAAALLDLADKRANGRDPVISAVKSSWTYKGNDETK
jgi:hypothetical protein